MTSRPHPGSRQAPATTCRSCAMAWADSPASEWLRQKYRCTMCHKRCLVPCRFTSAEFRADGAEGRIKLVVTWPPPRPLGDGTAVTWRFDHVGSRGGRGPAMTSAPRRRLSDPTGNGGADRGSGDPSARARATAAVKRSTHACSGGHRGHHDPEVARQALADLRLTVVPRAPGFVRGLWLEPIGGVGMSVIVFETKMQAEEALNYPLPPLPGRHAPDRRDPRGIRQRLRQEHRLTMGSLRQVRSSANGGFRHPRTTGQRRSNRPNTARRSEGHVVNSASAASCSAVPTPMRTSPASITSSGDGLVRKPAPGLRMASTNAPVRSRR